MEIKEDIIKMNCLYCNDSTSTYECHHCQTPLCKICQCKDGCVACEDCSTKTYVANSYDLISLCEKCFIYRIKDFSNSLCFLNWPGENPEEIGRIPLNISLITHQIVPKIYIYVSPEHRGQIDIEPIGISMEESLIEDITEKINSGNELVIIASNTLSKDILKKLCNLVKNIRLNIVWYKPVFNEIHAVVPATTRKAKPKDLVKIVEEISADGYPLCMKNKIIQKFSRENLRFDLNKLLEITKNKNLVKLHRLNGDSGLELLLVSRRFPAMNLKPVEMALKFFENVKLFPFLFRIQELLTRLYDIEASLNVIETFVFMIPGCGISSTKYRSTPQTYANKKGVDMKYKTIFNENQISPKYLRKYDEFLLFLDTMKNYRTSRGILVWSLLFKHLYSGNKPKMSMSEIYEFFEHALQIGDIAIQDKKIIRTEGQDLSPIIYSFNQVCNINLKASVSHPLEKPPSPQKLLPAFQSSPPQADFVTPQECINMVIGILLEYKEGLEISNLYSLVESLFAPRVLNWEHLEYNDFEDLLNCIKDIDVNDNFAIYHSYKKSEECPYCMDDLSDDDTKLECSHQFHKSCLMEIVNKTKNMNQTEVHCPMCRAIISQRMINIILGPAPPKKKIPIKNPPRKIIQAMPVPQPKKQASNHDEWLIPGVMKCLNNRCEYWFDAGSALKYKCPVCNIEYCLQCLSDLYHCVCKSHQSKEEEEFLKWMASNNIKPCPACGMAVSNDTNQASVNCIACNAYFCFKCGQVKDRCICC